MQAPLSVGFSRQEHWSGLLCPPPGGSSQTRDRTHISYVSYIGWRVLCHSRHLGSPMGLLLSFNKTPDVDGWDSRVDSCPTEATKEQTLPGSTLPSIFLYVLPLRSQVLTHASVLTWQSPRRKGSAGTKDFLVHCPLCC